MSEKYRKEKVKKKTPNSSVPVPVVGVFVTWSNRCLMGRRADCGNLEKVNHHRHFHGETDLEQIVFYAEIVNRIKKALLQFGPCLDLFTQ